MSFFKSRSGGSLYRINNLKGFLKYLSKKNESNIDIEKVSNKMSLYYKIKTNSKGE